MGGNRGRGEGKKGGEGRLQVKINTVHRFTVLKTYYPCIFPSRFHLGHFPSDYHHLNVKKRLANGIEFKVKVRVGVVARVGVRTGVSKCFV